MKLLIRQLEVSLEYTTDDVLKAVSRRLNYRSNQISSCEVTRRSLDSRPMRSASPTSPWPPPSRCSPGWPEVFPTMAPSAGGWCPPGPRHA